MQNDGRGANVLSGDRSALSAWWRRPAVVDALKSTTLSGMSSGSVVDKAVRVMGKQVRERVQATQGTSAGTMSRELIDDGVRTIRTPAATGLAAVGVPTAMRAG